MKYADKFKDPRWQKRRLAILDDRGWACELCCDETSQLHVHHPIYFDGRDPWDYEDYQLRALCDSCHDNDHHGNGLDNTISFLNRLGYTRTEIEIMLIFSFEKLCGGDK